MCSRAAEGESRSLEEVVKAALNEKEHNAMRIDLNREMIRRNAGAIKSNEERIEKLEIELARVKELLGISAAALLAVDDGPVASASSDPPRP